MPLSTTPHPKRSHQGKCVPPSFRRGKWRDLASAVGKAILKRPEQIMADLHFIRYLAFSRSRQNRFAYYGILSHFHMEVLLLFNQLLADRFRVPSKGGKGALTLLALLPLRLAHASPSAANVWINLAPAPTYGVYEPPSSTAVQFGDYRGRYNLFS